MTVIAHIPAVGTVASWTIVIVPVVALVWIMFRSQAGTAIDFYQRANVALKEAYDEDKREIQRLTAELEVWKGKTDITIAIRPIVREMKEHDARMSDQNRQITNILAMIAESLGPEDFNGDSG